MCQTANYLITLTVGGEDDDEEERFELAERGVEFLFFLIFYLFIFIFILVGFVKNQLSWFNRDLGFLIKVDLLQLSGVVMVLVEGLMKFIL